jgi:serine/threonine-protein kinase
MTLATPEHGIPIPTTLPLPTSAQHGHGPGLGEIYDGGDDHGTLYLITQAREGATLADELSRHHLSADEVRDLGAGIARALLPAHRRGWAHGALEADTVGLGPDRVTVAGLGVGEWLAHWAQVEDRPRYPAPEQLADREISPATDVFALGALLAEAAEPMPPTDPLSVLLRRMRAQDPAERPSTEEVLRVLGGSVATPDPPSDPRVAVVRRRGPDARTAPTVAALGGLAVAAALTLATIVVQTSDASPDPVAGGATVAASAAEPDLPGPLPLLIPPLARQALQADRSPAAPVTTVGTVDRHRATATRSSTPTSSSREEREALSAGEAPATVTTTADPTTAHSTGRAGPGSPHPRPTTDPPAPGSADHTATTTASADHDGTASHRPVPVVHRRADATVTRARAAPTTVTVTPTSEPDPGDATG